MFTRQILIAMVQNCLAIIAGISPITMIWFAAELLATVTKEILCALLPRGVFATAVPSWPYG
jgi:hypothetical protein